MAQKKSSIPFHMILTVGLVAVISLGALVTKQIKQRNSSSVVVPTPTTITPQLITPPTSSPDATIDPKVPKLVYPEGWTEYRNEKLGFLVAYPDESKKYWGKCAQYSTNTYTEFPKMVSFECRGGDGIGRIEKTDLDPEHKKRPLSTSNMDIQNISQTTIGAKNYPATKIVYKSTIANVKIADIVVFFVDTEKSTYILLWHVYNSNDSDSYKNVGESIFKTFQILN